MKLLIPGPVTTHPDVRAAMAQDIAPWDNETRAMFARLRERVRTVGLAPAATHVALPLQGCGHFATEAVIRTFVAGDGRLLVPMTGHYAERMVRLAKESGRTVLELPVAQDRPLTADVVAAALAADPAITHVGLVYSETSSGVVHDPAVIGPAVRAAGRRLLVDAVSAFGALPLDLGAQPEIDAAWFTTNKCLEGLPGLSFTLARVDALEHAAGRAGSWSFDLADIHAHTKRAGPGVFRFTPPAQVLASFAVALDLHAAEGGQPARLARYRENAATLHAGMGRIGLSPTLPATVQGPIVLNVDAPADPAWSLPSFVDALKARGFLISNFYNTEHPSFRVGCIGAVDPDDMRAFVDAVDASLAAIGVRHRSPSRRAA